MKKTTSLLWVGVTVFALFATSASAQIGAALNSTTNVTGATKGVINTEVDTEINAGIDAKADTTTKTTNVEINEGTKVGASSDIESNKTTEDNIGVSLKVNASGIAVTSSAQVSSEKDLEVFNSNISSRVKAVARVSTTPEQTAKTKVEVVYKHKGKLFGFIPLTIKSTTVVEAQENTEATVKSSLPWWSFLVTAKNFDKASLESRIKNDARIQTNAKVNVSAQAKAQVAEAVIAELEANATAQADANIK